MSKLQEKINITMFNTLTSSLEVVVFSARPITEPCLLSSLSASLRCKSSTLDRTLDVKFGRTCLRGTKYFEFKILTVKIDLLNS